MTVHQMPLQFGDENLAVRAPSSATFMSPQQSTHACGSSTQWRPWQPQTQNSQLAGCPQAVLSHTHRSLTAYSR